LRYFVRSYVTRPTTISAITEIPAKTPKPIGNTWSFWPGRVKPVVWFALAAAAVPFGVADTCVAVGVPKTGVNMDAGVVAAGVKAAATLVAAGKMGVTNAIDVVETSGIAVV